MGSWKLSTDHSQSSYGIPVLVHQGGGDAFGPDDIVQLFPSYGPLPAKTAVARLARTKQFSPAEQKLIDRFCPTAEEKK
jgi:hypothetical protein